MKLIFLFILLIGSTLLRAQTTHEIIRRVNDTFQAKHSPYARAFWDNAVYHTGNMEAYFTLGEAKYLAYSTRWAEHNDMQGAKSTKTDEWLYKQYGESDKHVLFGDWQICFQTYADLAKATGDTTLLRRAKEVMGYQIGTTANDYWWWVDALYMVMPVMTKMYKATGDERYLSKMREYVAYTDEIMWDKEERLYYRDGKYIYPKHKTAQGKKDFWARGNGWALAAYAKVLADLPKEHKDRGHYESRFKELAEAVVGCQQEEGYWTRSMLDPEQAPGYETSGTALFAYGLMWGVDNGILDYGKYSNAIEKAWDYLSKIALQSDGTVGYIQPIGEKAIPGQVVNQKSYHNFGVGAFLLAACERTRYEATYPRALWARAAYKMAQPVLSLMAEDRLQKEMKVELSPSWDGRNVKVTYMECFGRLMAGIAPWLALPDDDSEEGKMRRELREMALKAYANAVDTTKNDYLLWRGEGQALVDAAYLAESFIRGWDALWVPLDDATKKRYIREFSQLRKVDPPHTNWLLFSAMVETFLYKAGGYDDRFRITSPVRTFEEWYVGDSFYSDGRHFAFDYYNSFVIHPMLYEVLDEMTQGGTKQIWHIEKDEFTKEKARLQRYATILERFISPEGTFPAVGRSITYRSGAMQALALAAYEGILPEGLPAGQARTALTAVVSNMLVGDQNYNDAGFLTLGFNGKQPEVADWYSNNGSMYMASLIFIPLGLEANDAFWTDAPKSQTSKRAWEGEAFPNDHRLNYGRHAN